MRSCCSFCGHYPCKCVPPERWDCEICGLGPQDGKSVSKLFGRYFHPECRKLASDYPRETEKKCYICEKFILENETQAFNTQYCHYWCMGPVKSKEEKKMIPDDQVFDFYRDTVARVSIDNVAKKVKVELDKAISKHKGMNSAHEAYAVLLEEMDEFWDEVKQQKLDKAKALKELLQISAMAQRAIIDLNLMEEGETV